MLELFFGYLKGPKDYSNIVAGSKEGTSVSRTWRSQTVGLGQLGQISHSRNVSKQSPETLKKFGSHIVRSV